MPSSSQPTIEAVITVARFERFPEEIIKPVTDLARAVSDLETLHNAVEVYRAGGRGSDRGYQLLEVFGHCVKPAYVLGASLRISYPTLD